MGNFSTKEEMTKEYLLCAVDFEYCANKYFKVEDKRKRKFVNFKLLNHQKKLLDKLLGSEKNIITNKYRQSGITTLVTAFIAWKLVFEDNIKVALVANKLKLGQKELFKKTVDFIKSLPEEFRPSFDEKDSLDHKILDNGSELLVVSASEAGLRGFSPNLIFLDEMAFYQFGEEFWTASLPSISMGGRAICVSTPNGRESLFYELFEGAKTKNNDFEYVELKWYEDDRLISDLEWVFGDERIVEFDEKKQKELILKGFKPTSSWYREMCKNFNNDPQKIAQEIHGEFGGSGGSVIDDEDIYRQEVENIKDPLFQENFDRNFWIWEKPIENEKYVLSSDVSLGIGEDYSTISIIKVSTMEQVAEYQGKIQPDVLGEIIYEFGMRYNAAYTIVDITGGIGVTTIIKLYDLKYPNLHYSDDIKNTFAKNKLGQYQNYDGKIAGFQIGNNRTDIVNTLISVFRDDEIIIRSQRLVAELKKFKSIKGRADHSRSSHDDLIWALAMGVYVILNNFGKVNTNAEKVKAFANAWLIVNGNETSNEPIKENNPEKPLNNDFLNGFYIM